MKIAIGADHQGFSKKQRLIKYLSKKHEIIDLGTTSKDSVDYPNIAFSVAKKVSDNETDFGILICKTGIGMSIAANKVKNVRCAKVDTTKEAKLAKSHNNANVLAFGADEHTYFQIKDMINAYLKSNFSDLEKHHLRVALIDNYKEKAKK